MTPKPTVEADPLAHVLGRSARRVGRRERVNGWLLTAVLLSVWAGVFWWVGWGQTVVGELIAMAFGAMWLRGRNAAARRDWPRLKALGVKTRVWCHCDQCQRLRAEELAARRPSNAVES